ncbi:MAG: hypothetical protein Q7R96_05340 [Nanoarchaeota archaeon]|nr:hypothetical protein [Nanoarchaeota archaeon]
MKLYFLLSIIFLLGACTYTGEVVTIDTIDNNQDTSTPEEPTVVEPIIIQPAPQPIEEPPIIIPEENRYETPEKITITYSGTVIVKTGPSSYRVRLANNKELRILTREQLEPNDKITFTTSTDGAVTALTIDERPKDITRY